MSKDLTVVEAIQNLEQLNTPESTAILNYVKAVRDKNIVVLGADEAFVLEDSEGQIKAFKRAITLSAKDGTLIQPVYNGPLVISAQGYEHWAETTGASVIFPKEVLVGNEWKPNPHAERDPNNRRILAVYARAIAFRYSSMGIPQVSDWTTIFDTPSYRMIDLLAKAKEFPQAFKVLPMEMKPDQSKNETWASYPFDESMNLWIDTSHDQVIKWLSQILNREKKAMDFAQTFARRNALKHLSGLQKAPHDNWRIAVLAWRPTGNNIVKWDATQYSNLQNRVAGLIDGAGSDFENQEKIEINKGSERTSEDEEFEAVADSIDPEDSEETQSDVNDDQTVNKTEQKNKHIEHSVKKEFSKDVKQAIYLEENFSSEFNQALDDLGIESAAIDMNDETAIKVYKKVSEIVDSQN